ncbi:MAG: alpha-amylase family glycosyl hydrolase [Thermosynechococcaceae cyanobacterium]
MSSSIEFQLFAPYNKSAILFGSFSDWKEISMEKDEDGTFRTQVELEDGTHQYKYKIQSKSWFLEPDEWVEVIDPYATNIDAAAQTGIVFIKDGQKVVDTYVWEHDDHPLPADEDLVIYELHVGDFSGGEDDGKARGKFSSVISKLDHLKDLGINAIELMPIMEFPGDLSWGYNPRHFFAPESSYGSSADLKHLIDQCHARGIRVFLDEIYNHSESSSPLTQIDHDYWYHHEPTDPEQSWGPEFNYEHYDDNLETFPARKFIGDHARFWIEEYHIDGIRYDAARQIDNYDFLHSIVSETKQVAGMKPFFNIAEHVPETTDMVGLEGPMDSCWHYSFYFRVLDHICGDVVDFESLKDVLDCKRQGFLGSTDVVNFLTNHDHHHLMAELRDRNIFNSEAFKRVKLGAVLLMTAVGIPMLWMGEEFGEYKHKTQEEAKLDWTLLDNNENQNLLAYYKGLISLRHTNPALKTENIDFFHQNDEAKVIAYTRWNDEGSRIVIVANFSDQYLAGYDLPDFPADGTWHEWTRDYDIESRDGTLIIDLSEHEAQVFVWSF